METLKIRVFNWCFWLNPAMGGAEVFTCEVARRWVKAGRVVTSFTFRFPIIGDMKLRMGKMLFYGAMWSTNFK